MLKFKFLPVRLARFRQEEDGVNEYRLSMYSLFEELYQAPMMDKYNNIWFNKSAAGEYLTLLTELSLFLDKRKGRLHRTPCLTNLQQKQKLVCRELCRSANENHLQVTLIELYHHLQWSTQRTPNGASTKIEQGIETNWKITKCLLGRLIDLKTNKFYMSLEDVEVFVNWFVRFAPIFNKYSQ